jgi:hypothetical protein
MSFRTLTISVFKKIPPDGTSVTAILLMARQNALPTAASPGFRSHVRPGGEGHTRDAGAVGQRCN